jgi:hypothetical protein
MDKSSHLVNRLRVEGCIEVGQQALAEARVVQQRGGRHLHRVAQDTELSALESTEG